jgi:hypothetical protein
VSNANVRSPGSAHPANAAGPQKVSPVRVNEAGALDLTPTSFVAVTEDDDFEYDPPLRGVYVGTGGDLVVTDGTTQVTFKNVANAQTVIGRIVKVMEASTAGDLVGLR